LAQEVRIGESIALPQGSWNQRRDQHLASTLLAELPFPPNLGDRVLRIVDMDIFAHGLNFVFGEADMIGRRAIISN